MSNPRYVTAHGRTFLVETLDSSPRKGKGKPKKEAWAQVPLLWAAEMAKRSNSARGMVIILLAYLAWKNNSMTFALSSELTRRYGVTRYAKKRALAALEAAGLIKVDRRRKQTPVITLVLEPKMKD